MAYEGPMIKIPGLTASADLSAKQYFFVKLSGEQTVTVCSASTDTPIGVLQNAPGSASAAEVVCFGITKVIGSADLNFGDKIGTGSGGHAVAKTAGTVGYIVGQVIRGNSAASGYLTAAIDCIAPALLGT